MTVVQPKFCFGQEVYFRHHDDFCKSEIRNLRSWGDGIYDYTLWSYQGEVVVRENQIGESLDALKKIWVAIENKRNKEELGVIDRWREKE